METGPVDQQGSSGGHQMAEQTQQRPEGWPDPSLVKSETPDSDSDECRASYCDNGMDNSSASDKGVLARIKQEVDSELCSMSDISCGIIKNEEHTVDVEECEQKKSASYNLTMNCGEATGFMVEEDCKIDIEVHTLNPDELKHENEFPTKMALVENEEPNPRLDSCFTPLQARGRMRHNQKVDDYKCDHCDYKTQRKYDFKLHTVANHDPNAPVYKCGECDYVTKNKRNWAKHKRRKHAPCADKFICARCDYTTRDKRYFLMHMKIRHDPNADVFKCTECEYTTKWKRQLLVHMRAKHDPNVDVLKCDYCDYVSKTKSTLAMHVRHEHDLRVDEFTYARCDYRTIDKHNFLRRKKLKKWLDPSLVKTETADSESNDIRASYCDNGMDNSSTSDKDVPACIKQEVDSELCSMSDISCGTIKKEEHTVDVEEIEEKKTTNYNLTMKYCEASESVPEEECKIDIEVHTLSTDELKQENQLPTKITLVENEEQDPRLDSCLTSLEAHRRTRHKCTECKFTAKWKHQLSAHMRVKHDPNAKVHECIHCDYITKDKRYLNVHMRNHDPNAYIFRCTECEYTTRRKYLLSIHMRVKHNPNAKVHECIHCDYSTKDEQYLYKHMYRNHIFNLYECSHCEYTTRTKRYFLNHMKTNHECDYATKQQTHLSTYVSLKHTITEVYKCEHCEFTSRTKEYLNTHITAWHNPTSVIYRCRECEFVATTKADYCSHLQKHHASKAKVYNCADCGFIIRDRGSFLRHVRAKHDPNADTMKCAECSYTTKRKDYLSAHWRRMHDTNAEVYVCESCGYITNVKQSWNKHVRRKHAQDAEVYSMKSINYLVGHVTSQQDEL